MISTFSINCLIKSCSWYSIQPYLHLQFIYVILFMNSTRVNLLILSWTYCQIIEKIKLKHFCPIVFCIKLERLAFLNPYNVTIVFCFLVQYQNIYSQYCSYEKSHWKFLACSSNIFAVIFHQRIVVYYKTDIAGITYLTGGYDLLAPQFSLSIFVLFITHYANYP